MKTLKLLGSLLLWIAIASLLAACGQQPDSLKAQATPFDQLGIDPIFREYYDYLGGEDQLGPPISARLVEGPATVQFVETGKLSFDPTAPPTSKFRLAPIGVEMGVREPPVMPPAHPELRYVDGHVIFPDFLPLYEKLGGVRTVGKPLTEARFNLIWRRYEQFFENLGFYRMEGSPEVHLLAYGVWSCEDMCAQDQPPRSSVIDIENYIDPTFQAFVNQYGADFTGFALTDAHGGMDGRWEQVMENVVLVADSRISPESVTLQPMSEKLSILGETSRPYSGDPSMYFYPTDGDNGFEIPHYFWDFLNAHGGLAISGPPITHYGLLTDQIYHQCFTNLCLTYDLNNHEGARIRLEPLGYAYRLLYYNQSPKPAAADQPTVVPEMPAAEQPALAPTLPAVEQPGSIQATPTAEPQQTSTADIVLQPLAPSPAIVQPTESPTQPPVEQPTLSLPVVPPSLQPSTPPGAGQGGPGSGLREIAMQVWERFTVVDVNQGQEIGIWVVENDRPLVNKIPELTIKLPDGTTQTYFLPPTNPNGQSSLLLPVDNAENGTIVPYKVCVFATDEVKVCVADFFIIWNN